MYVITGYTIVSYRGIQLCIIYAKLSNQKIVAHHVYNNRLHNSFIERNTASFVLSMLNFQNQKIVEHHIYNNRLHNSFI